MPVFINIANIVVEKSTIARKYNGGIDQFKIDYSFGPEKRHQEDDKLFSIAFMGIDDSEIKYRFSSVYFMASSRVVSASCSSANSIRSSRRDCGMRFQTDFGQGERSAKASKPPSA